MDLSSLRACRRLGRDAAGVGYPDSRARRRSDVTRCDRMSLSTRVSDPSLANVTSPISRRTT